VDGDERWNAANVQLLVPAEEDTSDSVEENIF
jgi:hypothetical protein